jgi:hypothetical protein
LTALACLAVLLGLCCQPARAASGVLELVVVDHDTGEPVACRMHLRTATGQVRKAPDTPFWQDHFVVPGRLTLKLPLGTYVFEMERGPEYLDRSGHFTIERFADDSKTVDMRRFVDMSEHGWWSGDLDVRRPVRDIELLMEAEDLHVAEVLTWWNATAEENAPGAASRKPGQSAADAGDSRLLAFGGDRFCHVMAGGHERPGGTWLYFNLPGPLMLDAAKDEFPPPTLSCDKAREHQDAWIDAACPFAWDLPMLVANDRIDSIQLAFGQLCRKTVVPVRSGGKPRDRVLYPGDWGDGRWAQDVYFHLLNCGLRIPPSAGSGSGRTPNPVGYNRVYAYVDGELTYKKWFDALRAGRVTVTNGPLLRPQVEGQLPGHVFQGEDGRPLELEVALTLSTRDKISYLEIIKNGQVEHSVPLADYAQTGKLPKITFDRSGWFLVRAVTDLQETYRFALTGPYYVEFDYQPRISKRSAQFFLDWVYERARQLQLDDPDQRRQVIEPYRNARDFWQDLVDRATAE